MNYKKDYERVKSERDGLANDVGNLEVANRKLRAERDALLDSLKKAMVDLCKTVTCFTTLRNAIAACEKGA